MRNLSVLSVLLFLSVSVFGQNIGASFSSATFYSPSDGHYVETYMNIQSETVKWKPAEDGLLQAQVELTYIFKQDSSIITFSKELVKSPLIKSKDDKGEFFLNVQRISLQKGIYDMIIHIKDMNDPKNIIDTKTLIDVDIDESSVSLSDIQCLDRYEKSSNKSVMTKSGFDLIPYSFNIYPEDRSEFQFYAEIYNTEKVLGADKPYLLAYYLINLENNNRLDQFHRFSRRTSKVVDPFLAKLDISKLPTGNFRFVLEVKDGTNQVIAVKSFDFQRLNSPEAASEFINAVNINATFVENITDEDSLSYLIKCLYPIQDERDKAFAQSILKTPDTDLMKRYIFYFWNNKNSTNPELAFLQYMKEVELVNEEFGNSINKGYETDRGRVYLKYGPPNSLAKEYNDPGWLPYEIWHYYSTGDQRNIKFAFYATDRSVDDFHLLHSTARGEVQNYRWRMELRDLPTGGESIDDSGESDSDWGNKLNDLWNNPR